MKITLAMLRELPERDLERLSADDLGVARELVRSAAQKHFDEMSRLLKVAEGRTLTRSQQDAYDAEQRQLDELEPVREVLNRLVEDRAGIDRSKIAHLIGEKTGPTFRAGEPLKPEQRMEDYVSARGLTREDEEDLSFGKYLRGMITGEWAGADAERRALIGGTATAGGHLVPAPLSARIIDKARNSTRVLQAGAQLVPMETSTLKLARVTGDPTAAWHTEMATISASDMTFDSVTLSAHTLASRVLISRELMEDADNIDDEVMKAFAAQFALTVDLAALYGTGTAPEPRGVKNFTGVNTTSLGTNGAAPTYDDLIDAVYRLKTLNFDPTAQIMANRTGKTFAKVKDSTGQYLTPPAALDGIKRLTTSQVPVNLTQGSSSLASDIFTADWSELLVGVRTSLEITVLKERSMDVGAYELLAWWRGDIQVARPAAFDVIVGAL